MPAQRAVVQIAVHMPVQSAVAEITVVKAPLKQRCIRHFANCSGNEKNDLLLRFFITCYEFVSITYISAIQNPSPKNKKIKNCSLVIKNFFLIFPGITLYVLHS